MFGFLAMSGNTFAATPAATTGGAPSVADAAKMLQSVPLRFEPSRRAGQYEVRGLRFRAAMSANKLAVGADGRFMSLEFEGASKGASITAVKPLVSKTNVLSGNNRSNWRMGVANYGELSVAALYPGIGLRYYSEAGQLEYDILVAPKADPAQVKLRFAGEKPQLDADGNLTGAFLQKRPMTYQVADGKRIPVASRYVLRADGTYGISVGKYDRSKELVIDPVLTFSYYLAGTGQDIGWGVGLDSKGLIYVAGTTASSDFDLAGDSNKTTLGGSFDLFVAVLNPDPTAQAQLVYATYIGGANADNMKAMTVSPGGLVYMTGLTASSDFPMAGNSVQTTLSGTTDAFVAVLDPSQASGSALVYSTFFGGTKDDTGYAINFDAKGVIYLAGDTNSTDLPTVNPYQSGLAGTEDAFFAVLDPNQSSTVYATYFGGTASEYARGIVPLQDGTFWAAGGTYSSDFPVGGAPYNYNYNANCDAFLVRIDPTQNIAGLLYASYIGGSGQDIAETLTMDGKGRLVLSGLTGSNDFPVTGNAFQSKNGGLVDAFIVVLDPAQTPSNQLTYSSYYGGSSNDIPTAVVSDSLGVIHLAGYTSSTNLPVTADAIIGAANGGYDGFYAKINPAVAGRAGLDYATYVGGPGTQVVYGVAVDTSSNVYMTGYTSSGIFDSISNGASKNTQQGDIDTFVMGFSPCNFTLSAASYAFPQSGGSLNVQLTGGKDCAWQTLGLPTWLTVSPASGNGAANLTFTASVNNSGAGRIANFTVAGVPFLAVQ